MVGFNVMDFSNTISNKKLCKHQWKKSEYSIQIIASCSCYKSKENMLKIYNT